MRSSVEVGRDEVHAAELRTLAGRDVGDDEARRPACSGVGREALPAVRLEDRGIGHRHDRGLADEGARLGEAVQALRGAHPATERALGGPLDHRSVGEGIGEGKAELDHVGARLDGGRGELGRLGLADEVDDERLPHPPESPSRAFRATARTAPPRGPCRRAPRGRRRRTRRRAGRAPPGRGPTRARG